MPSGHLAVSTSRPLALPLHLLSLPSPLPQLRPRLPCRLPRALLCNLAPARTTASLPVLSLLGARALAGRGAAPTSLQPRLRAVSQTSPEPSLCRRAPSPACRWSLSLRHAAAAGATLTGGGSTTPPPARARCRTRPARVRPRHYRFLDLGDFGRAGMLSPLVKRRPQDGLERRHVGGRGARCRRGDAAEMRLGCGRGMWSRCG